MVKCIQIVRILQSTFFFINNSPQASRIFLIWKSLARWPFLLSVMIEGGAVKKHPVQWIYSESSFSRQQLLDYLVLVKIMAAAVVLQKAKDLENFSNQCQITNFLALELSNYLHLFSSCFKEQKFYQPKKYGNWPTNLQTWIISENINLIE